MTNQLEMPAIIPEFKIPTPSGQMSLKSLRPGDWVRGPSGLGFCVLINSVKLQRTVLWLDYIREERVFTWRELLNTVEYVGRGKPRYWLALLPKPLIKHFCLYSQP